MQTQINNQNLKQIRKHSLLVGAFLLLLILGAKVDLDLGGVVSFTLQTLFLGLAYYYLPVRWRFALILTYLGLGIAGVPVFNGGTGWKYFSSWPLGFFVGFVLAAFILLPRVIGFISAFGYFLGMHLVIVLLGVLWMFYYGGSGSSPMEVILELLPGAIIKSLVGAGVVLGIGRVIR
ncbi:biotin transporter BioY [Bacteroidia bacterium]|nr:biotin transporter BioY [Bacteroidia bacterium]MDB9883277.1 biotin transporter BioY [Bacteroidia bacterium]